jgi:hypothetical protein
MEKKLLESLEEPLVELLKETRFVHQVFPKPELLDESRLVHPVLQQETWPVL